MSEVSGTFPVVRAARTPAETLEVDGRPLIVKRDDRTSPIYGGNKVRRLERLLEEARRRGATRVLTAGAAGSHHVLATAIFGRLAGLEVHAVLVPQPASAHAEENLRAALGAGLVALPAPLGLAPLVALRAAVGGARAARTFVVGVGGSSPVGALGYVDAVAELADDVARGRVPVPSHVVVALGSGGTAAGLCVGLERHGLPTRVRAVAIARPAPALFAAARALVVRTARRAGLGLRAVARAVARLEGDGRYVGAGYARPTAAGDEACRWAEARGLAVEGTYTAKALAAALDLARGAGGADAPPLYWHTLSSASLGPYLAEGPVGPLPRRLARLFEGGAGRDR